MDDPNSPDSCDDDHVEGPSPVLTDPQVFIRQRSSAPDHSAEFTRLLNAVHVAVEAARSRGRLTLAEERAVLALLEALHLLVGEDDAP